MLLCWWGCKVARSRRVWIRGRWEEQETRQSTRPSWPSAAVHHFLLMLVWLWPRDFMFFVFVVVVFKVVVTLQANLIALWALFLASVRKKLSAVWTEAETRTRWCAEISRAGCFVRHPVYHRKTCWIIRLCGFRGFTNRLQLPEVKKGLQNKEVSEVAKLHFLILVAKQSHNYTSAIKCIIDSYDVVCKWSEVWRNLLHV